MPAPKPPFKRLITNYQTNSQGCWIWQGRATKAGYGQIKVFGKIVSVHRYSYELHKGNIAKSLEVMHTCNNKLCINPDHLILGTHKENIKQAIKDKLLDHSKINYKGVGGINRDQSIQVLVKGIAYGSIREAEQVLKLGKGTVRYWVKNKPDIARLITKQEYYQLKNKEYEYK